jgi:hypothetical protein
MIKFKKIIYLLIIFNLGFKTHSQSISEFSFEIQQKDSTNFPTKQTLFMNGKKINDSVLLEIHNTTNKEVNLFSTYLDEELINSNYLKRIDKKSKTIKLSFLPLITYLSPIKSDLIILGENAIVNEFQLKYNFIKIPPFSILKIKIISHESNPNYYFKDFNILNFNMFSSINWKKIKTKSSYDNFIKTIEFAIYEDVSSLITEEKFFENLQEYDFKSKDFKILTWSYFD